MDYLVERELNLLYIILDIGFLIFLGVLLVYHQKTKAFLFGLAGGVLYFIVDYGIFYLLLGTRVVVGANTFVFLLWLSISYGFTNFVWIWLFLDRDKRILEWSLLIIGGWIAVALVSGSFGNAFPLIQISRGTGSYHGYNFICWIFNSDSQESKGGKRKNSLVEIIVYRDNCSVFLGSSFACFWDKTA